MRWRLTLVASALALTACAPTRAAAPPEPELVGAPSPTTTVRTRPSTSVATSSPTATATPTSTTTSTTVPAAPPIETGDGAGASAELPPGTTLVPSGFAPDPEAPPGWAAFDQVLREELLGRGDPAASAAVMIDGAIVHAEAYGVRVPGTFEPVDANDRFRLASISKVVTAIVVLRLVDAGLITLEEPVGGRLAAALGVMPNDPAVAAITTEQLLSHTSGLPVHWSVFFGNGAPSCPDAARRGLTGSVAPPGNFRYSNMNYCLLGLLVEQLTGKPYDQAVYEWLLTPLGITGMRLAATYDAPGPDEVLHASVPGRSYMEALGAAGAWIASASDVARIVGSLSSTSTGWRPLTDETLARMRRAPYLAPLGRNEYGLGLFLYPDGSFGHTGTVEQTHAMVVSRPDGVTWAVLVNGEYPSETSRLRTIVDRAFAAAFPGG